MSIEPLSPSRAYDEMEDMMDSMGDLSFDEARRTIEGTPVPKSRSRGFSDEQEIDNLDKRLSYDTPISPIKTKPVGSVLIFQTGDTAGHDTGNHQETQQRTELLTGHGGALRREPLCDYVHFVSSRFVKNAELSDLLRVHDLVTCIVVFLPVSTWA